MQYAGRRGDGVQVVRHEPSIKGPVELALWLATLLPQQVSRCSNMAQIRNRKQGHAWMERKEEKGQVSTGSGGC